MERLRQIIRAVKLFLSRSVILLAHTFEGKVSADAGSERTVKRRKLVVRYIYNIIFAASLGVIISYPGPRIYPFEILEAGDIPELDIVSPLSMEIEGAEITNQQRQNISKRVTPVFDFDDKAIERWIRRWQLAFRNVRQEFYSPKSPPIRTPDLLDKLRNQVFEDTEQTLLPEDLYVLHKNRFSPAIERTVVKVMERLQGRIIAGTDLFPFHYTTGILIRHLNQDLKEAYNVHDLSKIWSLEQAQEFLFNSGKRVKDGNSEQIDQVSRLVGNLIPANLQFNQQMTDKRVASAIAAARPSIYEVKSGATVAKRGERVTEQQAHLLKGIGEQLSPEKLIQRFLVGVIILLVFLSILFRSHTQGKGFWYLSLNDSLFFLFITLSTVCLVKFGLPYLKHLFAPLNGRYSIEFLLPIASSAIIIHLMMGKEAAQTFSLLLSVIVGYLLDLNFFYSLWTLAVTGSAVQSMRSCKQRTDLYKGGLWSGTVGGLLVFSFSLLESFGYRNIDWLVVAVNSSFGVLSGLLSTFITSATIPILESIFGYTTSLKLLELSNFNHPLLHTLMMKAPGTYHHSVIVGSLAELAADRIGANGLLARVSAYYHDIGKMNKPLYFIENQSPNSNPHDHLQPTMSARILVSHVKSGVKMARDYSLGGLITHIIEQHHGTTLISYFFNKAKKTENAELDPVNEAHFRYPGPKPQTREAAVVMLADACEAATRSIAEPTPAKIQGMVHSIINKRFLEEQFSDCELTFRDLHLVEETFTRTLVSLYHHRIEYPGQKVSEGSMLPNPHIRKGA